MVITGAVAQPARCCSHVEKLPRWKFLGPIQASSSHQLQHVHGLLGCCLVKHVSYADTAQKFLKL